MAVAAAAVFVLLCVLNARRATPTIDEFAHVPAGCVYWRQGDFSLYGKNPPLAKLWMSLPVALDSRVVVPEFSRRPLGWGPWEYGKGFMDANRERFFAIFFRARLMIVALGLAAAALVFVWARRLFGERAAAVAASLLLLSPSVVAHSSLATVDAACMLTILAACWLLRRACVRRGLLAIAVAGAALGAALAVKFTAILVVPVAVVLPALALRGEGAGTGRRLGIWARDVAVLLLAALIVVHAAFGFRGSFRRLDSFRFHSRTCAAVQRALPGAIPVPLPRDFVSGFDAVRLDTEKGEFENFLHGRWSPEGWWYYNLVALAVKTPLLVLLLFLGGVLAWRSSGAGLREAWPVLLPAASILVFLSAFNRVNTGIRYVLPVLPFLHLAAGAVFATKAGPGRFRWRDALAAAAVAATLVTAVAARRDPILYFNPIAGGSSRGQDWLIDSNLDWGQDLYQVPSAVARLRPDRPISLLYCGHVDPALYGLDYEPTPPWPVENVIAVSVNFLAGMKYLAPAPGGKIVWVDREHLAWMRSLEPVERLGSIWVYDTRPRAGGKPSSP